MRSAFDADVLIFIAGHNPLGNAAMRALASGAECIGSVLLYPETLSKPMGVGPQSEVESISRLLSQLSLKPVDEEVATAATSLAAKYRLKAADAVHLATALIWGAEQFHTNNRKDFGRVDEVLEIVFADVG